MRKWVFPFCVGLIWFANIVGTMPIQNVVCVLAFLAALEWDAKK